MPPSDEDLVAQCLTGDQDAYTELYEHLRPIVGRIAHRYFVTWHQNIDFRHDATVKILMNLHKFSGQSKFSTWAFTTAKREAIDALVRLKSRGGEPVELSDDLQEQRRDITQIEAAFDLERLLSNLKPRTQAIILARKIEGWTSEEISEELGIGSETVRTLEFRAMRKMRNLPI